MAPRSSSARLHFLAIAVASLMLGACGSAEVARYHRFTDDTYLRREEPAVILPGPPSDLSDKGYVLLGHVEVRQPVRECEDTRCWEYTHERTGRGSAIRIASEHGGDVILLEKDRVLEREVSERQGRCIEPMHGPGSLRPRPPGFMPEDCWKYEAIPRVRELLVTEGYIWRHEPGRVSESSRALWRRWFEEGRAAPSAAEQGSAVESKE